MNFDTEKLAGIAAALDPFDVDCAITVALKITDDTCKMNDEQRALFMALYDALPDEETVLFEPAVFPLIEKGRTAPTPSVVAEIGTLREMAMEKITRPKMKAFKASIRKKYSA